jgi:hypothetical protein
MLQEIDLSERAGIFEMPSPSNVQKMKKKFTDGKGQTHLFTTPTLISIQTIIFL